MKHVAADLLLLFLIHRRITYLSLLIVLVLFYMGFILKLATIVHEHCMYISP